MMTKRDCVITFIVTLFFSFIYHIVTNLLSGEPILTVYDIKKSILPYMTLLIIALCIAYKTTNKFKR